MSLQTRLDALITAIGADIKALQAGGGGSGTGTKVSALTAATTPLDGTELVPAVQGGVTKRVTTAAIAALASSGAGDMVLAAAQVVTGTKTFAAGTLLMRNAAGTATAEPYSDVNPPATIMMTDIADASVTTPAAGLTQVFTNDGKILETKDDDGVVRPVDMSWENLPFSASGTLTARVGTSRYPITGGTFQIQTVAARVATAPTGASVILDVNKNGTTIYATQANRPTIAATASLATVGAHTATTVTTGDYLTIDIDQIGSTVAGADLVVAVRLQRIA